MYCRRVKLLFNDRISEKHFRIGFECEEIAREARPGQFLMVRLLSPSWEYLLSRPFSFCKLEGNRIELLFQVVGKGTRILSEAGEGALLEVLGPLGRGFSLNAAFAPVLVAGGMGIAPLPFLASELAKDRCPADITVLIGARTAGALCLREAFAGLGATVKVATDDGSEGRKGPVTELLSEELEFRRGPGHNYRRRGKESPGGAFQRKPLGQSDRPVVFACGPKAMLKTVARLTQEHNVSCQVSVEERMACGVGACMSCACKTRDEDGSQHYKMACVDGPVFHAAELVFNED